ncbi:MAG: hypothetical protein A2381_10220 [Bdellovibrionales bacterium RIFOXYB1_FULL_37_110]|nr:MAG: hypothetical protein A2417_02735 [Bdellovibrionales bacterium RIFOXYC1_FULL_37_79]OFZ61140.1 MAG: hypothetical protein A2381_10220 [Bdellovibrionales bacterium RIFOXYB1_FULL_37_110]OFZ65591.1 MAG: hypothetical protein A2577_02405 [Bdellovibrionales bacterium RIFOXYD1_FULL_36_51]
MSKIIYILIFLGLSFSIFGSGEFKTFKIKNLDLLSKKFKGSSSQKSLKTNMQDQAAPLIDRVFNKMKDIYQKIGNQQAGEILNSGYELGVLNNPSFFWQIPFGEIKISVRRQVDPDVLHDTRFIVTDELIITVDAHHLLTSLKNEGLIEITDQFLGLYAGLEFRRVYRFSHFAENFVDGLTNNYEYLFFPFFYFRSQKLSELSEYQYLERIDQLSAEVGGALNYQTPVYPGINLNAQAAFMYGYQNLTKVSVQVVGEEDEKIDELLPKVNISYEREKKSSTEFSAQLQLELLKLLKLTLLQYEYDYSQTSSKTIHLSFNEEDLSPNTGNPVLGELDKLFLGASFDDAFFAPYKVSEEVRVKQNLGSKYTVLFWKGMNDKETERVQTYQDGQLKNIFKHTFIRTVSSSTIWQIILPKLFWQIFNVAALNQYKEVDQRIFYLEYQSQEDLLVSQKQLKFNDKEIIFASFSVKYFASTFKSATKRKAKMTGLLRSYAAVDSKITSWVDKNELIPPMDLNIKTAVTQAGIKYFNKKRVDLVNKDILEICKNDSTIKGAGLLQRAQNRGDYENCVSHLQDSYENYYLKVLSSHYQNMSVYDFKILLEQFAKYFANKSDIERIFGKDNVFIFGKFSSKTKEGKNFVHNFKHGQLKSLGVIKDSNIIRSRAEITSETKADAQQDE